MAFDIEYKMPKGIVPKSSQLADRVKKSNTMLFEKGTARLPTLREKGNWPGFGRATHSACRAALQLGMLEIRENGVTTKSFDHLNNARNVARQFATYGEAIPEGQIDAADLDIPVFCCLLGDDLDAAKALAKLVSTGRLEFTAGDPFGVHVKMIAATVSDDRSQYEQARDRFLKMSTGYWWKQLSAYFRLYESVLDRDSSAFAETLHDVIERFPARATDVKFGNQLSEYGGLDYNQFAIDFMAVAIAKLALTHGISTDLDSPFFPQELV